MKIAVCGSMSASKEMVKAEKELKQLGYDVVLPEFAYEYAESVTPDTIFAESAKEKVEHDLIRAHFNKIKAADAVLVINVERKGIKGYIGGNSFLEMGFAFVLNKQIYLLHEIPGLGYRDEIVAMQPVLLSNDLKNIKSIKI